MPVTVIVPSTRATVPIAIWVTVSTRRFGKRSAIRPAYGESSSAGRNCRPVTMPSAVPEWVSSRTSQSWATRCIQVPVFEMIAPVA